VPGEECLLLFERWFCQSNPGFNFTRTLHYLLLCYPNILYIPQCYAVINRCFSI
jgi:hypothetical protein